MKVQHERTSTARMQFVCVAFTIMATLRSFAIVSDKCKVTELLMRNKALIIIIIIIIRIIIKQIRFIVIKM
jgi:hypothetical protein